MQLTGWEAWLFYLLAFFSLIFGLFTITARNAVHSALYLISTLLSTAALFLLLQAEFIAGVQILVYVGGVLVLFIFVVMLVNVREENMQIFTRQFISGFMIVSLLAIALVVVLVETQSAGFFDTGVKREIEKKLSEPPPGMLPEGIQNKPPDVATQPSVAPLSQNTEKVGQELYTYAALPFEIASVLLLVAIVGAVRLARERKQEQLYD